MKASAVLETTGGVLPIGRRLAQLVQFHHLAALTVVVTYALVVLGGTVRATDSGTACPDWPLCHGQVVPPFETNVMIEWSHRLVASLVGFLILGTVVWGWRLHRGNRLYSFGGILVVALLAGQVGLGGVTVKTETAASVVAAHLSMALALFSVLIVMTLAGLRLHSGRPLPAIGGFASHLRALWTLPIVTLLTTFALIIVGAYVSQMEAGLVYPDWPLFDGAVVSSGGRLADIHYAHRLIAAVAGVLVLAYAWQVKEVDGRRLPLVAAGAALILYAVQVIAGAANIWFELATSVRIVHLALASALWGALVVAIGYRHLNPSAEGINA
jgi:heme A synthase